MVKGYSGGKRQIGRDHLLAHLHFHLRRKDLMAPLLDIFRIIEAEGLIRRDDELHRILLPQPDETAFQPRHEFFAAGHKGEMSRRLGRAANLLPGIQAQAVFQGDILVWGDN